MGTSDNLKEAFAGESQANRKYTAFSRKADVDGFKQVAKLFRAVAEAETVHALAHFRVMGGVKTTAENLTEAMEGESYEFTSMYPQFVKDAEAEGNKPAFTSFKHALAVEKVHHILYSKALEAVKGGKDMESQAIWVCPVCGHTMLVPQVLDKCEVCGAAKERFFEVK